MHAFLELANTDVQPTIDEAVFLYGCSDNTALCITSVAELAWLYTIVHKQKNIETTFRATMLNPSAFHFEHCNSFNIMLLRVQELQNLWTRRTVPNCICQRVSVSALRGVCVMSLTAKML